MNYPRRMRRSALACFLLVASSSSAQAVQRTWLSGAGVSLVAAGAALAGFAVSQTLIALETESLVKAYGVPAAAELPAFAILDKRAKSSSAFSVAGFVGAGVLLAGGIVALVIDRRPVVSFVPFQNGGALVVAGEF